MGGVAVITNWRKGSTSAAAVNDGSMEAVGLCRHCKVEGFDFKPTMRRSC